MNPLRVCEGLLLFPSKGRGHLYFNINDTDTRLERRGKICSVIGPVMPLEAVRAI
jgi:hypothetical protein